MMHTFSKLLLAALPFTTLVGAYHHDHSGSRRHHRATSARSISLSTNKTYLIQDLYQGEDFFKYVPPI
jgi:hypothetical protein